MRTLFFAALVAAVVIGCKKPAASAPSTDDLALRLNDLAKRLVQHEQEDEAKEHRQPPRVYSLKHSDLKKIDSLTDPIVGVITIEMVDARLPYVYKSLITVAPTSDGWWTCIAAEGGRPGLMADDKANIAAQLETLRPH